jgi:hypothetical protein
VTNCGLYMTHQKYLVENVFFWFLFELQWFKKLVLNE